MILRSIAPYLLSALAGASITFAYAPFDQWAISPLAFALFINQCLKVPERPFAIGWSFGLGWFGAGISWVHVSIADFGGLPLVGSLCLMFLLCGYLAIFPAIAIKTTHFLASKHQWPMILPAVWFACEWLRSWALTGFPWLGLGYTQLESPLAGWIPVIGESGVALLVVLIASIISCWQWKRRWPSITLVLAVVTTAGVTLDKVSWSETQKTVSVGMVQGNIAQSLRWAPEQDMPTMKLYRQLSDYLWGNDLIIWPEAAVPKLELLATSYLEELDTAATSSNTGLITGIINYNFESGEVYNNLIALGANETAANKNYYYAHDNRYAKHHLLPIGEFVPFESFLRHLAPIFNLPMSSFNRGEFVQPNLQTNGLAVVPAICFEIAFPRQIRANLRDDSDLLLTVSNDAWFGRSHGPAQHLQIAQMRAKEFAIPVARATNNGISAFINSRGEIISRLPQFRRSVISDRIDIQRGDTPYRIMGDWPLSVLTSLVLVLFWYRLKKHTANINTP